MLFHPRSFHSGPTKLDSISLTRCESHSVALHFPYFLIVKHIRVSDPAAPAASHAEFTLGASCAVSLPSLKDEVSSLALV